jgi:hypothetical protein
MTFADVAKITLTVVASLGGGGAIVFGLSGFLGKIWADRALEKQRQEYAALNLQLTHSLRVAELEHQIRFSKLHEKRARVIAALHSRLVQAFREGQRFITSEGWDTDRTTQQTAYTKVHNMILDLYWFVEKNRIYLPASVCNLLRTFTDTIGEHILAVGTFGSPDNLALTVKVETAKKAYAAFQKNIPEIRKILETEFRKMLGVEPPSMPSSPARNSISASGTGVI